MSLQAWSKCQDVMLLFISFAYAFLCRCAVGKQCVCVIGLKKPLPL